MSKPTTPQTSPAVTPTIAITGATGQLGGRVAAKLATAGVPLRLVVRDAARAPRLPGTDVVVASYGDRAASVEALTGVRTLFMVSAAEAPDRLEQHLTFVDAAVEAGVEHIVYTSFVGAAPHATFTLARDHFHTEEQIRATGRRFTILRDSFYLDSIRDYVGDDGVLRGPAGAGRVAAVARADVADVAAAILGDPDAHRQRVYHLTGREAFSLAEAAETLSKALGQTIRYHDETVDEAYASRQRWQPEPWQADAWVSTYLAIASGELATVSNDVRDLIGRDPVSLAELVGLTEGLSRP